MYKKTALIVSLIMLSYGINVRAYMGEDVSEEYLDESVVSSDLLEADMSDKEEHRGIRGISENIVLDEEFAGENVSENSISVNGEKCENLESDNDEVLDDNATGVSANNQIVQPQENPGFVENGESISENGFQFTEGEENEILENLVSGNSVSADEIEQPQDSKEESAEKFMTKVSVPTDVQIHFDPQNLFGKGQIFSEQYEFINYGREDIAVKIKGVDVSYPGQKKAYTFSDETIENNHSETKEMNIKMVWENKNEGLESVLNVEPGKADEYVIYLKGSSYNEKNEFIKLNKGSKGFFYFTGTLNSNPDLQWDDGGIMINYQYEIINGEEAKEDIDEFMEQSRNAAVSFGDSENNR